MHLFVIIITTGESTHTASKEKLDMLLRCVGGLAERQEASQRSVDALAERREASQRELDTKLKKLEKDVTATQEDATECVLRRTSVTARPSSR